MCIPRECFVSRIEIHKLRFLPHIFTFLIFFRMDGSGRIFIPLLLAVSFVAIFCCKVAILEVNLKLSTFLIP